MNDCPFKKHCHNPKTESISVLGIDSQKNTIKVCSKCPLLLNAQQFKKTEEKCLSCGITFEEIVKNQKVGCSYCYLFIGDLEKIVQSAQDNNTKHKGKKSKTLLLHFFNEIIQKYSKENPDEIKDCKKLQSLIKDLF